MIQGIFSATTLPALERTAVFSERRHELLAGNVANIDTPGYRARDLSVDHFEKTLAASIARRNTPRNLSSYSPGQFSPQQPIEDVDQASSRAMEKLVYHDDSNVNMERQVAELAKNQGLHSLAIALMRSQFSVLNAAITERV